MKKVLFFILGFIGIFIIITSLFILNSYKIALKTVKNEEFSKAFKIVKVMKNFQKNNPKWYSLSGYIKFYQKDYDGAIADYLKAYDISTDEYGVMNFDNNIFVKYYRKDYASAIKDFDAEINKANSDMIKDEFLWDKAQFLYNIKDYKNALDIYNKLIIKSNSDNIYLLKSRLYYERGLVLEKLHRLSESQKDKKIAKELGYDINYPIPKPILLLDEGY